MDSFIIYIMLKLILCFNQNQYFVNFETNFFSTFREDRMINRGLCVNLFLSFQILKIISEEMLFGSPAIIATGLIIEKILLKLIFLNYYSAKTNAY